MTDMIERVAQRLFQNMAASDNGAWETADPMITRACMSYARAAIAAMREPTDEMNDAGADKCDGGCAEESCQFGFMGKIWTAMIDAALECSTKQIEK